MPAEEEGRVDDVDGGNAAARSGATEHWVDGWLRRLEALDLEMEYLPRRPDAFASQRRPIKIFLDGRLTLRLRPADDAVTIEFLTSADKAPRGCKRRGTAWEATFPTSAPPNDATQRAWLELLAKAGKRPEPTPVADTAVRDAFHRWVWESRERMTDRNLYDRDRHPFSEHMHKAFKALGADEQRLLRAQWEREALEEGPTVAEQLGWEPSKVMATYRSAMGHLKKAAPSYRRPRK